MNLAPLLIAPHKTMLLVRVLLLQYRDRIAEEEDEPVSQAFPGVCGCHACRAAIRWVRLAESKMLAVNADPDPSGRVLVADDGTARVLTDAQAERLTAGERRRLYREHAPGCGVTFKMPRKRPTAG